MTLSERVSEYVRACFTGIWIESHEHEDALTEIAKLCREQDWQLATWDIEQGLQVRGSGSTLTAGQDPLAAIRALPAMPAVDAGIQFARHRCLRYPRRHQLHEPLHRRILG